MECRDVRSLADAYLSEELLVETTQALVQHLERCAACRADIDARQRLRGALRSAFEAAPDLQARPEFLRELDSRLRHHASAGRRAGWRSWWATAAGVLLAIGIGSGGALWIAERGLAELAHLAAGDHQNCALEFTLPERPITLTEAAAFEPAFGRLESVQFTATGSTGEPIEFIERHSCVFQGQRFAHIVVRYKGAAVSLLVADASGSRVAAWATSGAARTLSPAAGFNIASFRSAGHAVFAVSTLPSQDVRDVARAMTAPIGGALTGV
jgi:anti-sigma factor RsiW